MSGDDKCGRCGVLRRYHDMPEAVRDHPFEPAVPPLIRAYLWGFVLGFGAGVVLVVGLLWPR